IAEFSDPALEARKTIGRRSRRTVGDSPAERADGSTSAAHSFEQPVTGGASIMRPFEGFFVDMPWLGVALFQATLIASAGWIIWLLARRFGPAVRAGILLASLVGVVVVPLVSSFSPVWLPLPEAVVPPE